MPHTLKIPLTSEFYDELEDAFIDKPVSVQKFIFDLIKGMCKDAKAGKLNKSCSVNLIKNGQVQQDFIKLKDVNLADFTLPKNPDWLPKDLEKQDARSWEHQITDKTMEYLSMYCQFVGLRFKKYNDSVELVSVEGLTRLQDELVKAPQEAKEALQKQIDTEKKTLEDSRKKTTEALPKSIEECVYSQVYPKLHQEVMQNMDTEFDKEFEEMYPSPKKAATSPPSPPPPGTRVQPR